MLRVIGKVVKQIKDNKIEKIEEMVYLIPETVSLTGVPDEMKKMKDGIGQHH